MASDPHNPPTRRFQHYKIICDNQTHLKYECRGVHSQGRGIQQRNKTFTHQIRGTKQVQS